MFCQNMLLYFIPKTFYIIATSYIVKFVVYVYIYLYTHIRTCALAAYIFVVLSIFGLTENHSIN